MGRAGLWALCVSSRLKEACALLPVFLLGPHAPTGRGPRAGRLSPQAQLGLPDVAFLILWKISRELGSTLNAQP